MKTIVDTSGKVLRQGDGSGLIVASLELGTHLIELSEVSDDDTINVFGYVLSGKFVVNQDPNYGFDFEILAAQKP